jgi:hypothetical protein
MNKAVYAIPAATDVHMRQGGVPAYILAEEALGSRSLEMFFSNSSTRLRRIGRSLEWVEAGTGQT